MAKWSRVDTDEMEDDPFAKEEKEPSEFEVLLSSDTSTPPPRHRKSGPTSRHGKVDLDALAQAFESKTPVEAKVTKSIKGGFEATIGGKRCFIPLTQMDIIRIEDPETYVGHTFPFLVIELKGQNVVLSRKVLLLEEQEQRAAKVRETLAPGQNHKVTITRIVKFGAFASIDGAVEGLIHINDMSSSRVKKIEDVVHVGDVVTAKILKIEHSPQFRMSLSLNEASEVFEGQTTSRTNSSASESAPNNAFAAAFGKAAQRKKPK